MSEYGYIDLEGRTLDGSEPASGLATRSSISLLIIDDNRIDRSQVVFAAKRSGIDLTIREASSVAGVDVLLQTFRPDIATVDYCLTDGCGSTAVETLRKCGTQAVIGVSGSDDASVSRSMLDAGASLFLNKSEITPDRLRLAIRACLEKQSEGPSSLPARTDFDRLMEDLVSELSQASVHELANAIVKQCAVLDFSLREQTYDDARLAATAISTNIQLIRTITKDSHLQ